MAKEFKVHERPLYRRLQMVRNLYSRALRLCSDWMCACARQADGPGTADERNFGGVCWARRTQPCHHIRSLISVKTVSLLPLLCDESSSGRRIRLQIPHSNALGQWRPQVLPHRRNLKLSEAAVTSWLCYGRNEDWCLL